MKRIMFSYLFLAVGLLAFFSARAADHQSSLSPYPYPSFTGELVPYDVAEEAASLFAQSLSAGGAFGPTVTYNGVDGKPAVYMFVLYLKDGVFPDESQILNQVSRGWEFYGRGMEEGDAKLTDSGKRMITQEGDFLTMVISARKTSGPVVEYFYGLPLHYTAKEKTAGLASDELSTVQVTLSQYIYASPFDVWFEFESADRKTYVSPLSFSTNTADEVFVTYDFEASPAQEEKIRDDWERIEEGQSLKLGKDEFRITGVPDFDWSYGCSPTASSDVLGYWDANGYPLLIDYYFDRWDPLEYEWDYNVPNVQQQLSWAMHTDSTTGGTSISDIGPGTRSVCNHPDYENNYGFDDFTDYDQILGYLINEIRLGFPAIWNVTSHPTYGNHSICAMGWGPPDTTYICVHDTWSSTPEERLVNWYGWSGDRYTVGIRPGDATLYHYNNVHASNASMTVTNYGPIGDESGQDFMWNGTDQLFDGTLILAWVVPGDTLIAMDMFATHSKDSWYPYDNLIITDTSFGEFGTAAFIDTIGLGVEIQQYSVGSSDPTYGDFILQQYVIRNLADTSMQAYVSLSLDWDLFDAYDNDSYGDSLHNLAWHWCPSQAANRKYKLGVLRIPTDDDPVAGYEAVSHQYFIYPQEGWRDDQLWQLITKNCWQDDSAGYDISLLMTPGLISLSPDSSHLESFIIFGVDTTQHLIGPSWWRPMLSFCGFYRGDVNQEGVLDVGDLVYLINYLYRSGDDPLPFADQGDLNGDDVVEIADIVFLINYLYRSGPTPRDAQRFLPPPLNKKFERPSLFLHPIWQ
jgi:hypothetical protein